MSIQFTLQQLMTVIRWSREACALAQKSAGEAEDDKQWGEAARHIKLSMDAHRITELLVVEQELTESRH